MISERVGVIESAGDSPPACPLGDMLAKKQDHNEEEENGPDHRSKLRHAVILGKTAQKPALFRQSSGGGGEQVAVEALLRFFTRRRLAALLLRRYGNDAM
jgi:hypothetical protein